MPKERRPILVLVPLPPTYRGGTEEYAYRLARRVSDQHPVRILTTTVDPTPDSPPLDTGAIPIRRLPASALFQRPLVRSRAAFAELRSAVRSAALLHLHMPFPFVEKKAVRWAKMAGIPVVLTYHMDADFAGASGLPGAGLVTFGYRTLSAHPALRGADAVVSNSRGYAEASPVLSRYMSKVRVIAKGVDPVRLGLTGTVPHGRIEPGGDLLPGADPLDRRVLFVGRLVPYKGVGVLLDAVAKLRRTIPRLRLYIAGNGPEKARLQERVNRLELTGTVRFLGFVPDDRLGALYRSVDVVACTSIGRLESTATTLEEAASLGTPTLGSDLAGTDETVPNDGVHGLLCPPGNVEAVTRALDRLLGQPRPIRTQPLRTWEETAGDYLRLFAELGVGAAPEQVLHNPDNTPAG
jgi:glycosyltransferase involved in cell wall biosynthesis